MILEIVLFAGKPGDGCICAFKLCLVRNVADSAACISDPQRMLVHYIRSISQNNERNIINTDRYYIALFSALEQTHCAHVACNSE